MIGQTAHMTVKQIEGMLALLKSAQAQGVTTVDGALGFILGLNYADERKQYEKAASNENSARP